MRSITLAVLALSAGTAGAQLVVDDALTPTQLVEDVLVGSCVSVSNVSYNGVAQPASPQTGSGSFTATNSNLGMAAGVVLSSGLPASNASNFQFGADGTATDFASTQNYPLGTASDPDLAILAGGNPINDRTVLEFDFIPVGDSIKFRYIFGSEEYTSFTCTQYFDVFGFFLSGPGISGPFQNNAINIALVPGGNIPVGVNTVNGGQPTGGGTAATCAAADPNWQANSVYYVDNLGDNGTTVTYDGFTVVLTARAAVQCGETYHIKLAIADASDGSYDSGVFLEAGSFSSVPFIPQIATGPSVSDMTIYESCFPITMDIVNTACDLSTVDTLQLAYSGTATMGVDITPAFPTQLIYQNNQSSIPITFTVPVDFDGPETFTMELSARDCNGILSTSYFTYYLETAPPPIVVGGFEQIPCMGSTTLTPTVTGGFEPYVISWSTGQVANTIDVAPLTDTVYTVTVTDDCGSSSIAQFFVELEPLPPLVMNIVGSSTLMEACESNEVQIMRPGNIPGDVPVSFSFSGGAQNGPDFTWPTSATIPGGSSSTSVPFQPLEDNYPDDGESVTITGTYTDACGRTTSGETTITIIDAPAMSVTTEDHIVECVADSLLLVATGMGGVGTLDYTWSNGTQGPVTYVTMQVPGTYTVTVTDDCGRTAQDIAMVETICDVIIPNVITPNGDGSNDMFEIEGIVYVSNTVRIFNRWGQEVYTASNYKNQWNGGDLPDGTYYYEVTVSRKDEPYTGHLTILRNGW